MEKWGFCIWHPSYEDGVPDEDKKIALELFNKIGLFNGGTVFKCLNTNENFLTIQNKNYIFRCHKDYFKFTLPPNYDFNETVKVIKKSTNAVVNSISWHFKRQKHIYTLIFDTKLSSKWYFEEELEKINSI